MNVFNELLFNPTSANDELLSAISGWNRYCYTNKKYRWVNNYEFPIIRCINTEEKFHIRPFKHYRDLKTLEMLIDDPPSSYMIWPVDIVYQIKEPHSYYMVFKNLEFSFEMSLGDLIDNWNNVPNTMTVQQNRFICNFILTVAEDFYRQKYAYYGWNANNIWIDKELNPLFCDYIENIDFVKKRYSYPTDEFSSLYCDPAYSEYGSTFDYFSLMTLLFYILVGRLPYDGKLLTGIGKSNTAEKRIWYESYRKNCIFIFDPNNNDNEIGAFSSEERYINRWKNVPETIKKDMISFFVCDRNHLNEREGITPQHWLKMLESYRKLLTNK